VDSNGVQVARANRNPYVGFNKDRRSIKSLWERFNSGLVRLEDVEDSYQRMLLAEWQRCMSLGVDVAMNVGRRLTEEEYLRRRAASRLLLEKSRPVIDGVSPYLEDVPGIFILTEGTGSILHVSGRAEVRAIAEDRSGIMEGSQWDERVAGSNGIGSAIAKLQPVHVYSSEHFCEGWHSWSCAAAPIIDSDGQTLIGVIDFTTIDRDYRDQALGLVVSIANSIQAQIASHRDMEKARLLAVYGGYRRRYPGDDVLVFDRSGRAIALDPDGTRSVDNFRDPGLAEAEKIDILDPETQDRIGTIAIQRTRLSARSAAASAVAAADVQLDGGGMARFGAFQSCDPATKLMMQQVHRIAAADVNVLIAGETGTGKELLAQHIHASSGRKARPYIAVNCGAITKELLESTFFGYVRGAFSGADPKGRAGYFEAAGNGTLFLDEIGELPLQMQAALLRVLEDGSYHRVGSSESRKAHCRIIAATNRNLEAEVARGVFRQDLYYRLKIMKFDIYPLRDRACDVLPLAHHFLGELAAKHGRSCPSLTVESEALLTTYGWPGNVRELRNAMEACVLCADGAIGPDDLPGEIVIARGGEVPTRMSSSAPGDDPDLQQQPRSLVDHERHIIICALHKFRKVNRVAKELGIARSTLYKKFSALGIDQSEYL